MSQSRLVCNFCRLCHTYSPTLNNFQIDSSDALGTGTIMAQSIWGILRGLETFSQMLIPDGSAFHVYSTQIMDFPRFGHR